MMKIPYIPQDAPFNGDQRAWLAGFLAGLHSRTAIGLETSVAAAAPKSAASVLNILVGTQTGNAEALAMDIAAAARTQGMQPVVTALDDVSMESLGSMKRVIVVTSTYGEGEMPDNAQLFWEALAADSAPRLDEMNFAVLALGDTGYDGFCQAGKLIDTRFEQLGGRRMKTRIDCDIDFEDAAAAWIGEALPLALAVDGGKEAAVTMPDIAAQPTRAKSGWSRRNPYPATVGVNRRLSGSGSSKEIRHYEFDLRESGLDYEAGDALGVVPLNNPKLAGALLGHFGAVGDSQVAGLDRPVGDALLNIYEISTPSRELVAEIGKRAGHEELSHILANGDKEQLAAFLWSKDILDLLNLGGKPLFELAEFVTFLKPLQHRAYSISSSPLVAKNSVHLTIASVRYRAEGRERGGICSTYLADRVDAGQSAGIFVSPNKAFRVPQDDNAPVIMVGPGTGIAPFRAFLQERQARGARGKNWLFFGDQHRQSDFIYENELGDMSRDGVLTRLDLAFSRDQAEKIYVQTRMRQNGKALYQWLEEGGYFYVCGDATRMAKDVDDALHSIISDEAGISAEAASDYVNRLKREKRYLRDVY
ncbi:diflavin oxidoreductase [Agrobacterium fabrum]|uniref:Sulfite reductase [NADPH] flavoprotein alpha-component n=1 Tax=Agrobacterium fabrum TaxID=1176649 RepID=A0A7Z7BMV9_9HYPH|nr:sulfite reductase flavoprotein subunit alpha [Agrobacterium fabrum]MCR6723625.1 sulfite reductase flavoprotein subunit alpha [Agrobacterium fabrum]UXT58565.1 sulfite reductase flavoprotein subunit alpha [Agrobacterium fabrum]WCK76220.1 sulfite reductase flavoprotein subunit alpha [Agrobacterium fabrum]WIE27314.1 sulfite reductase flavoprotein subunit alpha [Agrobacterium fabrum]WIE43271.1 sulfite reductase flavoprotein subunit alpha [Agrobacterium fabrum]